jgi:hypothetical protein
MQSDGSYQQGQPAPDAGPTERAGTHAWLMFRTRARQSPA